VTDVFENHTYNLMAQMVEEQKSLWRIKRMYKKDAKGCKEDLAFWKKMEKEKEETLNELGMLLESHIGQDL
jgi:hypothetical protein